MGAGTLRVYYVWWEALVGCDIELETDGGEPPPLRVFKANARREEEVDLFTIKR